MCGKLVHSTMHQLNHIVIICKSQYVVMKGSKFYVFAWRCQTLMLKVIALTFGEEIDIIIFGCCIDSTSLCWSLKNVVSQKCALCFMFSQIQLNLNFKLFELSFKSQAPRSFFIFVGFEFYVCALCTFCFFFLYHVSSTLLIRKNFRFFKSSLKFHMIKGKNVSYFSPFTIQCFKVGQWQILKAWRTFSLS
jgi:hypothetical protein